MFNNVFTLSIIIIFSPIIGKLIRNLVLIYKLYNKSKSGNELIDLLNRLTFREFEVWASEYLFHIGFSNIVLPPFNCDYKKNILSVKNGKTYYIKCNRSSEEIELSTKFLENFLGEMIADSIYNGVIITTNKVSMELEDYVCKLPEPYNIKIIALLNQDLLSSYTLNIN